MHELAPPRCAAHDERHVEHADGVVKFRPRCVQLRSLLPLLLPFLRLWHVLLCGCYAYLKLPSGIPERRVAVQPPPAFGYILERVCLEPGVADELGYCRIGLDDGKTV